MAENIFGNLLAAKRERYLETISNNISNVQKEREAYVKGLQEVCANSLSKLIDEIFQDLPSTCTSITIRVNTLWASPNFSKKTNDCDSGFGFRFSLFANGTMDYSIKDKNVLLIPYRFFDTQYLFFGPPASYDKSKVIRFDNLYYYGYLRGYDNVSFYIMDKKAFHFISLDEIFGGEFQKEYTVDFSESTGDTATAVDTE